MRKLGCLVALFSYHFCTLQADDNNTFHYLSHLHANKTEENNGTLPTKSERVSSCEEKNTCLGHDCNYWIKRGFFLQIEFLHLKTYTCFDVCTHVPTGRNSQNGTYNTCESLESDHGCNCAGCWCDCESDCSGTFCGSNMDWLGDGSCDDGSTVCTSTNILNFTSIFNFEDLCPSCAVVDSTTQWL